MKLTASEKNIIASKRLKYVMKLRKKRPVDLINYVLENTDIYVSAPMMSQYLDGKKHIPQNMAVVFAEYLNIDAGYILGLDGFNAHNDDYYVYCSVLNTFNNFKNLEGKTDIYDVYLSHEGYRVKSFKTTSQKITRCNITDKEGREYILTPKKLDQYVKDLKKYYKTRTKELIKTALKEGDADD